MVNHSQCEPGGGIESAGSRLSPAPCWRRPPGHAPDFTPGSFWSSEDSMDVLAAILESVDRCELAELMQTRLFGPLGMTDSSIGVPRAKLDRVPGPSVASSFGSATLVHFQLPYLEVPQWISPECPCQSDLWTTAGDTLRFSQMLLAGGELEGARVLKTESVRSMMTNRIAGMVQRPEEWPIDGYGLGLQLYRREGQPDMWGLSAWKPSSKVWRPRQHGMSSPSFFLDPTREMIGVLAANVTKLDPFRNAVFELVEEHAGR